MSLPPPPWYVTPADLKRAIESAQQAADRAAAVCAESVRVRLEAQETIAAVRSAREHR
jgi:hypothetical protein